MTGWLLTLVLHAQPAPVLEPDPGGWKRLQPRQMDASSFLANGWNQFEQNYLPLYAADDDPATAWVEGAAGPGVGESLSWYGPKLSHARTFRIFIRGGYQKSKVLYEANVRPHRVRLEPLVPGRLPPEATAPGQTGIVPGGVAREVDLGDVLGWQKVELPVPPAVEGFRLTVLSVYPGTKYEDLCISDVQVYVDGDDTYVPAAEQVAAQKIRAAVAERQAAAAAGTKAAVELSPRYAETSLGSVPPTPPPEREGGLPPSWSLSEALTAKGGKLESILARARAAAADYDGAADVARVGHPVRVASTAPGLGSRATALAAATRGAPGLSQMLRYLALKDFAIFESTGPDRKVDPVTRLLAFVGRNDPVACVAKCRPVLRSLGAAAKPALQTIGEGQADGRVPASCDDLCRMVLDGPVETDSRREVRGAYAIGAAAAPGDLVWNLTVTTGDRDAIVTSEEEVMAYRDGLASALVAVNETTEGFIGRTRGQGTIYLFDWDRSGAVPKLARMYRVAVSAEAIRVDSFEPA